MKLRDYQKQLICEAYAAWEHHDDVLLQLETGGGKTVTFTEIIAQHESACVIAHRTELIHQISLTLARRGLYHRIVGQPQTIRDSVAIQMQELGKSFYNANAKIVAASVDTLLNKSGKWCEDIKLVVIDEAHHVLKNNKWGTVRAMFPNAKGLHPTATPARADGMGLGRHADGVCDVIIRGPSMRELIHSGALCDYIIAVSPTHLDLSNVSITATGDYSAPKLRDAVHKAHLTGDIVGHYLKLARGKLGITFAVDIEAATEIAAAYREAGIPAEVISSKTPALLRASMMRKFKNREILQLVNVDILGEGVDVPAVEVISFARPTQSYVLYKQQFGRGLRTLDGKTQCIIIDHAGNVMRHGLPDSYREWSLDRREKRGRGAQDLIIKIKTCASCFFVYSRELRQCPYCGVSPQPQSRSEIDHVDGDLILLDAEVLARMRGEIKRIDNAPRIPVGLPPHAQMAIQKNHAKRQDAQRDLRDAIAQYAGQLRAAAYDDGRIHRNFYLTFGVDIMTAQTLNVKDAEKLRICITGKTRYWYEATSSGAKKLGNWPEISLIEALKITA